MNKPGGDGGEIGWIREIGIQRYCSRIGVVRYRISGIIDKENSAVIMPKTTANVFGNF